VADTVKALDASKPFAAAALQPILAGFQKTGIPQDISAQWQKAGLSADSMTQLNTVVRDLRNMPQGTPSTIVSNLSQALLQLAQEIHAEMPTIVGG
jgi:hypothetical protein